jgi:hypothetical protein
MDTSLDERVRVLRSVKTDQIAHSERALLDHLLGTRQMLVDWGARPALCDAGLFHSVYGTEHFAPTPAELSRRPEIQRLIGPEAEQLAWLFCIMRRDSFDENLNRAGDFGVRSRINDEWIPLSIDQFHDLVTLTFANTLEAYGRLPLMTRKACRKYLLRFRPIAMEPGRQALDSVCPPPWQVWR